MLKILKNQDGFSGLIGLLIAIVVIGIMSAMMLPTFTAKMQYKQAQYAAGVIKTIENAENAYMAKNNSFADLTTLSSQGYLSDNFLQSVQGAMYPQPNWINLEIANQTVNVCIDNGSGCPNNPGVGNNGYFIGIYGIPPQFQTYIEHEFPGSGASGTQDISYVAPIPSSPPVANAQNANYATTAGYANSSGLPAWSQEANALVDSYYTSAYNNTGDTLYVSFSSCYPPPNVTTINQQYAFIPPGAQMPALSYYIPFQGVCSDNFNSFFYYSFVLRAYSG